MTLPTQPPKPYRTFATSGGPTTVYAFDMLSAMRAAQQLRDAAKDPADRVERPAVFGFPGQEPHE